MNLISAFLDSPEDPQYIEQIGKKDSAIRQQGFLLGPPLLKSKSNGVQPRPNNLCPITREWPATSAVRPGDRRSVPSGFMYCPYPSIFWWLTGKQSWPLRRADRTDKWDEQVLRIGETVTHEKPIAAPHRGSSTHRPARVEMTIGIDLISNA